MSQGKEITVEVVLALEGRARVVRVSLPEGATVADAIGAAGLADAFTAQAGAGIWGRRVDTSTVVRDGDRVEIYRMLRVDPGEARRRRAGAARR